MMEVALLGSFAVRHDGETVQALPVGSQRLVAFLAVHDRAVDRIAMAGRMWPEVSDEKARASLRSALTRLDARTRKEIVATSAGLGLGDAVTVDFRDSQDLARRLVRHDGSPAEPDLSPSALAALSDELLPRWYDDWVVTRADDWRQLRVNALEALADLLTAMGRLPGAASAARAAVKVEPLRESAHACLVRVHLAEGNQSEALRVFDSYRALLLKELSLEPTPLLSELVVSIRKQ